MSSTIDEGGATPPAEMPEPEGHRQHDVAPELLYELFRPTEMFEPTGMFRPAETIAPPAAPVEQPVPDIDLEPFKHAPPRTSASDPGSTAAPNSGSSANATWRDSAPYDETGVLIRPADWSTDRIETALINVGSLREQLRDEDEQLSGPRRTGIRRLIPTPRRGFLLGIMFVQAFLSLRDNNTAFEDEALYLYSGHLELAHLIYHQPIDNFAAYFSGAPVLYPVLGAIADQIGGVFAARLLSLAFMLGATGLVYLTGRRLFGVRSALCGAGLFATTASAIFMGGFATYDAPSVFLLTLAGWIVVRGASSSWPYYVVAVLPMILAVGTKYASLLFVPTIIALACISALPYHGWRWSLLRPVALTALIASMAYGALKLAGPTWIPACASASGAAPRSPCCYSAPRYSRPPTSCACTPTSRCRSTSASASRSPRRWPATA
jgi:hypothetical protein